jgi:hypothetical protein|tara:strand:+ start:706 stop:825 length:120 start_codon:yes stop_codon:yes gene_type:complete
MLGQRKLAERQKSGSERKAYEAAILPNTTLCSKSERQSH